MPRWVFFNDQRASTRGFAKIMLALASLTALADVWTPIRMPAAVTFAVFAMWCFNASQWMQRFADMQARIDMMLTAQGKEPE